MLCEDIHMSACHDDGMSSDHRPELDRSSAVPLYFQVAQQIELAIERGELGPGAKLDNEIRLADRYGNRC